MKQLGKLLVEEDMLTQEQLDQALAFQAKGGGRLGNCLVKLKFLSEEALFYFLAVQLGVEFVELDKVQLPPEKIRLVSRDIAARYQILPWEKKEGQITLVSSDPTDSNLLRLRE